MPELEELVKIEITKPLPATGVAGTTYKIEGSVKMFDAIGAPPWVYAEVRRKEWWKPEIIEEVSYERGFPMPVTGTFSIDIKPEKKSDYEVTLVATPAPLSLPVVGVFPVVGKSDMVKIRVAEPTATDIKNIEISVIGLAFPATDIKNITIGVIGVEFPSTDIKNIAIGVIGPEFPSTDMKNITIGVIGPEFPSTDIKNIEIALVAVPVGYKGKISKKELEYNESRASIPAYNIPQDERGKVHIWGRNDMATSQKLGIHWIVKDPDGLIVEDYQDWQFGSASPGATHEFISPGRFDLNKPGTWTISISLAMNPTSPLTVASYAGVLCTVVAAPPEEYTLEVTIEPPGAGHVLISPKGPYSPGEVVTLVATPYSGYEFDHWGGWPPYPGVGSTSSTLKLTMTANWWVVAAFRKTVAEYTLTWSVTPSGGGTILPASGTKYPSGTSVTLRATATSGYEFDHWGGAASGTSRTTTIVMSKNQWVRAYFKEVAPPTVYYCPYCSAQFATIEELYQHIDLFHPGWPW
ncbi:hypothetical protein ES705_28593 [subsurface metagenome]